VKLPSQFFSIKLRLIVLLSLVLTQVSCESYKEVSFNQFTGIRLVRMEGDNVILGIKASLDNPNAYDIKIKKSKFNLSVNGKHIGKTTLDNKITLKKNATDVYEFHFVVNKKELMSSAFKDIGLLFGKKPILKIEGKLKAGAFGVSKKFPVSHEQPVDVKDLKLF
jgi:LEA14-like dessication related protein